ncbi:hypothetical protein LEP1GSC060_1978 [Leptospira weilii serovar Ranarum str. ICFT]|uniref:Uncharacterized protein n=1 Tax=Leptospira weilii serovar Ranarum str. ICFT TaxID=1218598 RepID=N1WII4_9LEPT|nr:hypothetical protein LEP1GSC060_1978 [Leptospira weilii serovar Ranarum str. ICFT]
MPSFQFTFNVINGSHFPNRLQNLLSEESFQNKSTFSLCFRIKL